MKRHVGDAVMNDLQELRVDAVDALEQAASRFGERDDARRVLAELARHAQIGFVGFGQDGVQRQHDRLLEQRG